MIIFLCIDFVVNEIQNVHAMSLDNIADKMGKNWLLDQFWCHSNFYLNKQTNSTRKHKKGRKWQFSNLHIFNYYYYFIFFNVRLQVQWNILTDKLMFFEFMILYRMNLKTFFFFKYKKRINKMNESITKYDH